MIADKDVAQTFRNIPLAPIFSGPQTVGRQYQIYRGLPGRLWKDAHPLGCARHLAVFNKLGVIPQYCFDCYKVLIEPRSILEQFKLLMIFERIMLPLDNTRKCMVESRNECSGAYKGFIYCRGMDDGNEVRKIVRKVVSEEMSPHVPVTLKRGCSEYAQAYPAYARVTTSGGIMQYKKEWQAQEDVFDRNLVFHPGVSNANAEIADTESEIPGDSAEIHDTSANGLAAYTRWEIFCMQYWLRYAATIGDSSYLAIAGSTLPDIPNLKRPPFRNTIPVKRNR